MKVDKVEKRSIYVSWRKEVFMYRGEKKYLCINEKSGFRREKV